MKIFTCTNADVDALRFGDGADFDTIARAG
jgi:hypothetical protein